MNQAAIRRQNELMDLNLKDVYEKISLDDDDFADWMRSMGLLNRLVQCPKCNAPHEARESR